MSLTAMSVQDTGLAAPQQGNGRQGRVNREDAAFGDLLASDRSAAQPSERPSPDGYTQRATNEAQAQSSNTDQGEPSSFADRILALFESIANNNQTVPADPRQGAGAAELKGWHVPVAHEPDAEAEPESDPAGPVDDQPRAAAEDRSADPLMTIFNILAALPAAFATSTSAPADRKLAEQGAATRVDEDMTGAKDAGPLQHGALNGVKALVVPDQLLPGARTGRERMTGGGTGGTDLAGKSPSQEPVGAAAQGGASGGSGASFGGTAMDELSDPLGDRAVGDSKVAAAGDVRTQASAPAGDAGQASGKVQVLASQGPAAPSMPISSTTASVVTALGADAQLASIIREASQVASQVSEAPRTIHSLRIQLNPHQLGAVTANLTAAGDELSIELQVETTEAQHRLSSDSDEVIKSLRAMGFDIDRITIQQAPHVAQQSGERSPSASFDTANGGSREAQDQQRGQGQERNRHAPSDMSRGTVSGARPDGGGVYI